MINGVIYFPKMKEKNSGKFYSNIRNKTEILNNTNAFIKEL